MTCKPAIIGAAIIALGAFAAVAYDMLYPRPPPCSMVKNHEALP